MKSKINILTQVTALGSILVILIGYLLNALPFELTLNPTKVVQILLTISAIILLWLLKKRWRMSPILSTLLAIFVYGSLFLGSVLELYSQFWWWDDLLHTASGFVFGYLGLTLVPLVNKGNRTSKLMTLLFALSFSLMIGVAWEFYEFFFDSAFKTSMQSWDLSGGPFMFGKTYQGDAVRDTISDLLQQTFGTIVTVTAAYFLQEDKTS